QRRDLRRGQRLSWRDRGLPRNPAPAGTARRHLVPRPARDAGTWTEPRDRPRLRGLSAPQRRRLRAREFKALAVLSLAIETPFIPAPAFARVNSSGNPEGLGPRFRGDERMSPASTGSHRPLALRCRRRSDAREEALVGHPQALPRYALAVASHLGLIAAWYLFVKLGEVPKFVMPSPYDTVQALLLP